jgi:hypothetical protein
MPRFPEILARLIRWKHPEMDIDPFVILVTVDREQQIQGYCVKKLSSLVPFLSEVGRLDPTPPMEKNLS